VSLPNTASGGKKDLNKKKKTQLLYDAEGQLQHGALFVDMFGRGAKGGRSQGGISKKAKEGKRRRRVQKVGGDRKTKERCQKQIGNWGHLKFLRTPQKKKGRGGKKRK